MVRAFLLISSPIRTIPSALEFHQINLLRLVGYTTGQELHHTLKTHKILFIFIKILTHIYDITRTRICQYFCMNLPIIYILFNPELYLRKLQRSPNILNPSTDSRFLMHLLGYPSLFSSWRTSLWKILLQTR